MIPCLQINDRYEFPDELDLDYEDGKYLSENADRSVRNLYRLHSVLVHSGGVHGGHYYAFIRPDGKHWFKFDDEKVPPAFIDWRPVLLAIFKAYASRQLMLALSHACCF